MDKVSTCAARYTEPFRECHLQRVANSLSNLQGSCYHHLHYLDEKIDITG